MEKKIHQYINWISIVPRLFFFHFGCVWVICFGANKKSYSLHFWLSLYAGYTPPASNTSSMTNLASLYQGSIHSQTILKYFVWFLFFYYTGLCERIQSAAGTAVEAAAQRSLARLSHPLFWGHSPMTQCQRCIQRHKVLIKLITIPHPCVSGSSSKILSSSGIKTTAESLKWQLGFLLWDVHGFYSSFQPPLLLYWNFPVSHCWLSHFLLCFGPWALLKGLNNVSHMTNWQHWIIIIL